MMFYRLLLKSTKVMEGKWPFGYNLLHVTSCARKHSDLSRQITPFEFLRTMHFFNNLFFFYLKFIALQVWEPLPCAGTD